jgi:hypothetical protein
VDITMTCKACARPFVITESEQAWFRSKKDENGMPFSLPLKCLPCRQRAKERRKRREAQVPPEAGPR